MGCGWRDFGDDWIHIDGGDYSHLDYNDITKLEFIDNSVDLIYASHVIEYFDRTSIINILSEWKRVLKPNGILRIAVPDFNSICRLYMTGDYKLDSFTGPLYGRMDMGDDIIYHKTTYDYDSLQELLSNNGFTNIDYWDWRDTDHGVYDDHSQAYIPKMDKSNGTLISLNIECNKI